MKIKDIGEFGLIGKITKKPRDKDILIGIGDDAAVIKQEQGLQVLTTDCLVEGDHFRREWFSPKQIGMKAIEINVSDVAAIGGQPKYALVSLALPQNLDVKFVEELVEYSAFSRVNCHKIVNMGFVLLPVPVYPSHPLFKPVRVPWNVVVYH